MGTITYREEEVTNEVGMLDICINDEIVTIKARDARRKKALQLPQFVLEEKNSLICDLDVDRYKLLYIYK